MRRFERDARELERIELSRDSVSAKPCGENRRRVSGLEKKRQCLAKAVVMFYICSHALIKETARRPIPSKPFRPPRPAAD